MNDGSPIRKTKCRENLKQIFTFVAVVFQTKLITEILKFTS